MARIGHIINKQVFEFECAEEHAFQIQNKMGKVVQDRIFTAIERACDKVNEENNDLIVPLLEVDLGDISFEKMDIDIAEIIEKKFYEKLLLQRARQAGAMSKVYSGKRSFDILKSFFLTGQLPWFAGKQDDQYFAELFASTLNIPKKELKRFILLNLYNDQFIRRLSSQSSILFIDHVIQSLEVNAAIIDDIGGEIENIITEMLSQIQDFNSKGQDEQHSIRYSEQKEYILKKTAKAVLDFFSMNKDVSFMQFRQLSFYFFLNLMSEKKLFSDITQFYSQLRQMIKEKFEIDPIFFEIIQPQQKSYNSELYTSVKNEKEKIEKYLEENKQNDSMNGSIDTTEKFYISNAGLVILADYFPIFFKELGLLQNGTFTKDTNKIKAVFLLHYLCTGKEEVPEFILPLNKILCGIPLEDPLPSLVALTIDEKNECAELLSEIINNWQRLGNSSIENLREAFLNREGILSYENNGWKLQVERRGYDVLLESLPWSFKHIKLSWMQDLIVTQW